MYLHLSCFAMSTDYLRIKKKKKKEAQVAYSRLQSAGSNDLDQKHLR